MPPPTTGVYFNQTSPAATPGDQNVVFQSDGGQPSQAITAYPRQATTALRGTVKPDGTSITIDTDGTIHAVATTSGGGTGGGGGTSASNGAYVCVVPSGAKDGSNTQYTIPAPVLAGTGYWLVRNDAMQRQLGPKAYYSVQGTQITLATPLQSDDYIEFYYVMGTPNSEGGGGGGVNPVGNPLLLQNATGTAGHGTVTVTFGNPVQTGSCIVIEFYGDSPASTITDSSGNTYTRYNLQTGWGGGLAASCHYVAINVTGGSSFTITTTGGGMWTRAFEYAAVSAVDGSSSAFSSLPPGPLSTGSATATVVGDIAHLTGAQNQVPPPSITYTNGDGWGLIDEASSSTILLTMASFSQLLTAAGSVSNTITSSNTAGTGFIAAMLLLKPL